MSYAHNQRKKRIKRKLETPGKRGEKLRELAKFIRERRPNVTISNPEA